MSFESHEARGFLLRYLLNQLVATKNVYVKLKVLQLLTALVERGHIEFKISLSKQTEGIAEASSKEHTLCLFSPTLLLSLSSLPLLFLSLLSLSSLPLLFLSLLLSLSPSLSPFLSLSPSLPLLSLSLPLPPSPLSLPPPLPSPELPYLGSHFPFHRTCYQGSFYCK